MVPRICSSSGRLARRVQRLALAAAGEARAAPGVDSSNPVRFVGLGDRRKAHDLPVSCASTWPARSSSCSRCMISTIALSALSLSRL